MLRSFLRLSLLVLMVSAGSAGFWWYHNRSSDAAKLEQEREKNRVLQDVVQRLTQERRVAEILVTDQKQVGGELHTTVLWVEQARDGSPLPARSFTVKGRQVYITGLCIRFEQNFIMENDPLRGRGIILFSRIFGENQTPAQGLEIDTPDKIPDIYRGNPAEMARVSEFETGLWKDFWKLVNDKTYRLEKGVAIAGGKAVFDNFQPNRLYRITIDAGGSPTMDWEPIKPIYQEALRKSATTLPQ